MAGPNARKRNHQDFASKGKFQRPQKKQRKQPKKQARYHSDSEEEDNSNNNPEFQPVNLLDSDVEDFDNAAVDDLDSASEVSGSDSEALDSDTAAEVIMRKKQLAQQGAKKQQPSKNKKSATTDRDTEEADDAQPRKSKKSNQKGQGKDKSEEEEGSNNSDSEQDSDQDSDSDSDDDGGGNPNKISLKKRNDPSAFATSMSKILSTKLSTKLSTTRRSDPLLSRSADAHRAAQQIVDGALESKARRHLREQKRLASEKGRVRDVVTGGGLDGDDGEFSAGGTAAREKRLRKTAHKGVVMLFRAVREAQERATEAEDGARKEGVVSRGQRGEKAAEMSRQGFLDLIAGGGGKLKKGALEEA